MTKSDLVKQQCKTLKLASLITAIDDIIHNAEKEQCSYLDLVNRLMDNEIQNRKAKDMENRKKTPSCP